MTRRADRLFQIVQILRGRRLTTAAHLADRLGVSERTVYRDIRDLSLSGVPVEGEAGSGYRLMSGFDLPPLMLTNKESEALIVAIRLLKTWGGESLSRELESAQEKVLAILPEESRRKAEQTRIYALELAFFARRRGKSKTATNVAVFCICSLSLWERVRVRASARTVPNRLEVITYNQVATPTGRTDVFVHPYQFRVVVPLTAVVPVTRNNRVVPVIVVQRQNVA